MRNVLRSLHDNEKTPDARLDVALILFPRPALQGEGKREGFCFRRRLFTEDFQQDSLGTLPVEFAVKDLLPRTEVQLSLRDGDDDFASHDLPFQMRVRVVFSRSVVVVDPRIGVERSKLFQPGAEIVMQPGFVIVDED